MLRQQLPVAVDEYVSEQLEVKRKREGEDDWPAPRRGLPLANRASPTIFGLRRGELVFFRRFPVFFGQNPTLNRKKSFRCAKRASFFFFFGPKKVFFEPKKG